MKNAADIIRAIGENGKWKMGHTPEAVFPTLDFSSWFYRNCKIQRRKGTKICGECPFRAGIENQERIRKSGGMA